MRTWGVVFLLIISVITLSQGFAYTAGFIFVAALCVILFFFRKRETQIYYVTGIDLIEKARMRKVSRETSEVLELKLPTTSLSLKGKAQ
jgi:hypothetical protein